MSDSEIEFRQGRGEQFPFGVQEAAMIHTSRHGPTIIFFAEHDSGE